MVWEGMGDVAGGTQEVIWLLGGGRGMAWE